MKTDIMGIAFDNVTMQQALERPAWRSMEVWKRSVFGKCWKSRTRWYNINDYCPTSGSVGSQFWVSGIFVAAGLSNGAGRLSPTVTVVPDTL